jgi:16S rRNA G966 N2-methylase RsmD
LEKYNLLLSEEVHDYINNQIGQSVSSLALQKNPFLEIDWKLILNQIEAKAKAKDKLPTWFSTSKIIFPSKEAVEQTSSEQTAQYKSNLIIGNSLIDLTGGFGVDTFYFSKRFSKVTHCERNNELSEIVKHNISQLKVDNINCIFGDSELILSDLNQKFDWIYIDPSRRSNIKGKVFILSDCEPNVPDLLDFYFNYSSKILIKTAPLLDLSAGLKELKNVANIHIIALENEVKELLWEIKQNHSDFPIIKTVNITKNSIEKFEFKKSTDTPKPLFSEPEKYLYEPNAAVMKSGGFDEVSNQYDIKKLHQHSHLYTSDKEITFCGRVFEIQKQLSYNKIEMKFFLENQKANVTVRNFPETVENIRKRWRIKDGGELYCFFTTDLNNNKIVLLCKKLK